MLNNLIQHLSCEMQETYGKDEWNLYILVGLLQMSHLVERIFVCCLFENKLCG